MIVSKSDAFVGVAVAIIGIVAMFFLCCRGLAASEQTKDTHHIDHASMDKADVGWWNWNRSGSWFQGWATPTFGHRGRRELFNRSNSSIIGDCIRISREYMP